jgi:hypothetical protein
MTIEEIKRANAEAGQFFFEASTMRFFDSRVSRKVYGSYFVTSERGPSGTRRYSVRKALADGSIDTIGEFNQMSRGAAHRLAARLSREA